MTRCGRRGRAETASSISWASPQERPGRGSRLGLCRKPETSRRCAEWPSWDFSGESTDTSTYEPTGAADTLNRP